MGVGAVDGLEGAVLQPPGIEFRVAQVAGEAAEVGVHPGDALQAHLEGQFDLGLEAAPGALDIAAPRQDAVALGADEAGAHQVEQAPVREVPLETLVDQPRPFVAERVVQFVAAAIRVADVAGMGFRFAEVAPPAGDSGGGVFPVGVPEPRPRRGGEDIDQPRPAEE